MKVLKFLVAVEHDNFFARVVDYLIDCGHFVDIIDSVAVEPWLDLATHNIKVVNLSNLIAEDYDYLLDFNHLNNCLPIPRLEYSIEVYETGFNAQFFRNLSCNLSLLAKRQINLMQNQLPLQQLGYIFEELTELFIDGIVFLLRENEAVSNTSNFELINNKFDELLAYKNSLTKLSDYYKQINENEEVKFKLIGLNNEHAPEYKNFTANYKLGIEEFEFFAIWLLTLFNARQKSVYHYDLAIKNKVVSKYITIDPNLSYLQICELINDSIYDIVNNTFYSTHGFADFYADICLEYDVSTPTTRANSPLVFCYISEIQQLSVEYDSRLYFLDNLPEFYDYFTRKILPYKEQIDQLYKVLFVETDLFDKQLVEWNNTSRNYPQTATIHELFSKVADENPEIIAIVTESGVSYTYGELESSANKLANYLIEQYKIINDDLVVVCIDKSEQLIIAILAVLKAGAAYVPMDASYPEERIKHILADTGSKVILTNQQHCQLISQITSKTQLHTQIVAVDNQELRDKVNNYSEKVNQLSVNGNNLAYVIYTSGTTGKPKGAMIEHHGVVSLVVNPNYIDITSKDGFILLSDIAFDAATFEIWGALLNKARLFIPNDTQVLVANLDRLKATLIQHSITIMWLTKTLFDILYLQDETLFKSLRYLLVGGEALDAKLMCKVITNPNRPLHIINGYGPTENTTFSCTYELTSAFINQYSVPIGKALSNRSCYVLDQMGNPVPVGVVAELYLGGAGLARGYLNRPELTEERFVPNNLPSGDAKLVIQDSRLYKTGDLVRYLPDGNIEYIGRNDSQVKIRGYRIELNEIEAALSAFPHVKQNIVLAKEHLDANGNLIAKYLIAYYVAESHLPEKDILEFLNDKLPDYMVPATLVYLPSFPVTANGKINVRALPVAEIKNNDSYVAPRTEIERKLCAIWAQVLGTSSDSLSIYADFFDLGGNSILAIKLIYQVNRILNKNIEIKNLYKARNIALFAEQLDTEQFMYSAYQIKSSSDLDQQFISFPISNVQQAYAIGRQKSNTLGGVSTHVYYEAVYQSLDKLRLEKAVNSLIKRHVILKSQFNNDFTQAILNKNVFYSIREFICNNNDELLAIRGQMAQEVIPFTQVPLFNMVVSRLAYLSNKYILHFSFDALLLDVASIRLFIKELDLFYNDPELILPPLLITFRDYRNQLSKIYDTELYRKDKEYWSNKLNDYDFAMGLPLACNPSEIDMPKFARIAKIIPKTSWEKIVNKTRKYGISLTAVVLMAYAKALAFWSNQERVCVNLTLFNRLPLHDQINDIMGDFTILELFNYFNNHAQTILGNVSFIHETLWEDIKHTLFDGIDFLRMIRQEKNLPLNAILAPVVLTSVLGEEFNWAPKLGSTRVDINFITAQTPQVWIDNKAYEIEEGFVAEWDYVEQLFDKEVIAHMHADYCHLIEVIAEANWERDLLPELILPNNDLQLVMKANAYIETMDEVTLFDKYYTLANEQNYSILPAVIDAGQKAIFTHHQLIEAARFLAKYLILDKKHKSHSGELVAVLSEKGFNQPVATLAIMEAGYGYLPLHVDWPHGRINDILVEGKVTTVVISKEQYLKNNLGAYLEHNYQLIIIEDILASFKVDNQLLQKLKNVSLPCVKPDDIAYVIFTSGSTGKPKGVTISHRGALNTINAINHKFNITSNDRVFALSELSFDLSVYDIFGLLITGGAIVYPEQQRTKEPEYWIELVNQYQVTIWNTVPQLAELLVNEAEREYLFIASLRLFLLSGDWIPLNLPDKLHANCSTAQVVSLGGATEGSIWSIWYDINTVTSDMNSIPYGVAMPNQKIYILDHYGAMCPVGVIGEIHIGGVGVALNYWGDIQKTKDSFRINSMLGRVYKTGDLGRWHPDGYVEFMGRKDNQVKLNGYRVELEEIAAKLSQLPGVDKAVVKLQPHQERNLLVAYLVPEILATDTDVTEIDLAEEERMQFRVSQHGLNNKLHVTRSLNLVLDENLFRLRKSYRNFIVKNNIDTNLVNEKINSIAAAYFQVNKRPVINREITELQLNKLLATIAGLSLSDKATPKYRFPSGGSSYGVRTYIDLAVSVGAITSGNYYFHPTLHALCSVSESTATKNMDNIVTMVFKAYLPAITPLYGKFAHKLAYIEMGHMLGLLTSYLDSIGLSYAISVTNEEQVIEGELLLGSLQIGVSHYKIPQSTMSFNLLQHNRTLNAYVDKNNHSIINLNQESIFTRSGDFYQTHVMEMADAMLSIDGDYSLESLVNACIIAQKATESLYQYNIGSCMLGITPYQQGLYALVLGVIANEDKLLAETKVGQLSLKDLANNELSMTLPDYMLPYDYIVLNELPLSVNGKLDINKLPLLTIEEHATYVAPRNLVEEELCELWQTSLKANQVGITDNFIRLGGNSITAIQLSGELKSRYEVNITIGDLLNNPTIEQLVANFNFKTNQNISNSEEDVLWI